MLAGVNNRRVAMVLVTVMAVVAIAIPTCSMIGCDMGMSGGMPFMPSGTGIFNACTGEWVTSTGPAGVLPSGAENLVLALSAVLLVAALVLAPRAEIRAVPAFIAEPPPPPEDPLGQRTRI
jgi:hypothetical protein